MAGLATIACSQEIALVEVPNVMVRRHVSLSGRPFIHLGKEEEWSRESRGGCIEKSMNIINVIKLHRPASGDSPLTSSKKCMGKRNRTVNTVN